MRDTYITKAGTSMLVVDWEKSERGPQRRKTGDGRLLHCCCICLKLAPWGPTWAAFYSLKEEEDCVPFPKFCSSECRERGGPDATSVTDEMKRKAKDSEWRDPEPAYREATAREKYNAAAATQKQNRRPLR